MDWADFWTKLGGGLIGALIGGSVVSFYSSYYSKKGERALIREELPQILEEEREKAFKQEAGKRAATHADIENVLKEVQAVTRETETIKATIDEKFWNRRNMWEQRRNLYGELIEAVHEQRQLIAKFEVQKLQNSDADPKNIELPSQLVSELLESNSKYKRHAALAQIFLPEEAYAALHQYVYPDPPIVEASKEIYGATIGSRRLNTLETALIKAARNDLLNE